MQGENHVPPEIFTLSRPPRRLVYQRTFFSGHVSACGTDQQHFMIEEMIRGTAAVSSSLEEPALPSSRLELCHPGYTLQNSLHGRDGATGIGGRAEMLPGWSMAQKFGEGILPESEGGRYQRGYDE